MFWQRFVALCNAAGKSPNAVTAELGFSTGTATVWKNGATPRNPTLRKIADYFGVPVSALTTDASPPEITEDYVSFPVIGEVAAGYDHCAFEDWSGERIDVPRSWLRGRGREDFFALRVIGDSMFPQYQDGDVVLVLRQDTMDRSGQIGVVVYDDDNATLKRVDYVAGEDWMRLSPVNPSFPPVTVRDERLEHCRVLGIPKYLIREIQD